MSIPAFIVCRDILSSLKPTVAALEAGGITEIYFVDNDSTWGPLRRYYRHSPHRVINLRRNLGKKGPWKAGIIRRFAGNRPFIVTDPDIVPYPDCPGDWLAHFQQILDDHPGILKVGFGLPTDDLPARYEFREQAQRRQAQHWLEERRIPGVGYRTPLDTTLALYRPKTPYCTAPAIRTEAPYVARHLGWYINSAKPSKELQHYRRRADRRFGNWTKKRLPNRITSNPDRVLGSIEPKRRRR